MGLCATPPRIIFSIEEMLCGIVTPYESIIGWGFPGLLIHKKIVVNIRTINSAPIR
jgi:hypothetical protein